MTQENVDYNVNSQLFTTLFSSKHLKKIETTSSKTLRIPINVDQKLMNSSSKLILLFRLKAH